MNMMNVHPKFHKLAGNQNRAMAVQWFFFGTHQCHGHFPASFEYSPDARAKVC